MPLIFQTEVEGSLERLEQLVDERPDNLREKIITMAQELAGLGEMLDLPAFIQLCQSAEQYAIGAADHRQVHEVAAKTLQAWQRAQALVLTDNVHSMPTQLTDMSFGVIAIELDDPTLNPASAANGQADERLDLAAEDLAAEDLEIGDLEIEDLAAENDALVSDIFASLGDEDDALVADVFAGADEMPADAFAGVFDDDLADKNAADDWSDLSAAMGSSAASPVAEPVGKGTEFRFSQVPQPQSDAADLADNTVRVSVRKLNELNDYFGELTIERNRLDAEVKQLRRLVKDLGQKLRSLDEINDDVRDVYEHSDSRFLLAGTVSTEAWLSTRPHSTAASPHTASTRPLPSPESQSDTDTNTDTDTDTDNLRQNFDALEFDRYHDAHLPFRQIVESVVKLQEVADDIELSVDKTEQTTRVIHRTARYLQRNLNQLRMRPLSDVTNRFPRALRDLELEHGKAVTLALEGENLLVDRNILEALNDPLMHIVRNAFDHGIEPPQKRIAQGKPPTGTIAIKAANRSNRTVITVSDDGNGINLEKIRDRARTMGLDAELLNAASESELLSLIFEPGFSTADQVSELSGRGVGMDVVRNNLTQIRGDISVDTQAHQGTTFTISVPYTLSVTRVMLAEGNRMPVALPTDMIEEVAVIDPASLYEREGREMFHFKGEAMRLIRLSQWLAFNCPRQFDSLDETPNMDHPSVLIFRMGEQPMGLEVDRSWGEQEVAVRRVEGPIALPAGFSNCTILGDGKVIPLISLPDLARWVINCEGSNIHSAEALYSNPVVQGAIDPVSLHTVPAETPAPSARFLVIDDSVNVRRLLALTLEKAGYEVEQARDGQDAFDKLDTGLAVDGIVCDVEMPRMDGYSFLSRLRARPEYETVPVTMLTSRSGEKHRTLAMNLGATAYFSKPYQERALLESLAETLAAAHSSWQQ
ncbi:MAG: hybrid sensor histidine kinase/response regulator [Phormidesmis sp. RL_2_1]|nr:hybrid sensor histidine kinase/response regulator [Phormidesmis sp. RL_2_1]